MAFAHSTNVGMPARGGQRAAGCAAISCEISNLPKVVAIKPSGRRANPPRAMNDGGVAPAAAGGNPQAAYLQSCRELNAAIGTLEDALIAFTGKPDDVKGRVFERTRARLDAELSAASGADAAASEASPDR